MTQLTEYTCIQCCDCGAEHEVKMTRSGQYGCDCGKDIDILEASGQV